MRFIHTIVQKCLQATIVQLFLILISLPILVGWGLPVSYLTSIGTILFTPVLTVYLWCSLLVFFTTVFYIPNDFFISMLSLVSDWWLWVLSCVQVPHVLGFISPPPLLLMLIPLTGICAVICVRRKALWIVATTLALVLGAWIFILYIATPEQQVSVEHHNQKKIPCYYHNGVTTIVDVDGSCGSITDGTSWLLYTVMPTITQKTGASYIDRFVAIHPRQRTFEALTALCKKGIIHDVYVPWWEGHIPINAFLAYMTLKETLAAYGHHVYYLSPHKQFIIDAIHTLKVTDVHQTYGDATYPLFIIDNRISN